MLGATVVVLVVVVELVVPVVVVVDVCCEVVVELTVVLVLLVVELVVEVDWVVDGWPAVVVIVWFGRLEDGRTNTPTTAAAMIRPMTAIEITVTGFTGNGRDLIFKPGLTMVATRMSRRTLRSCRQRA